MKKYFSVIILLCVIPFFTKATHIVGGEFQLVQQRGGLYDIYLNLYFDDVNGNPQAKDQTLSAYIFRKSDNARMDIVTLRLQEENLVDYDNPDCRISEVETRKITYAVPRGFQFDLAYNDPQGYYIVWDRCCRNDAIVNIVTPGDVGMLFYLHFPPIYDVLGNLTNWSSPAFSSIPGTYACIGEPFTLDFGATDIDGDSLVYSMSTPLKGNSTPDSPIPGLIDPEPYRTVTWLPGINNSNQIPGTPALNVDLFSGLLSMTPSNGGLHVFSVLCEEFRDGVKIGEVRRDFQIFVYDNCDDNSPPSASISLSEDSLYNELRGDTIVMSSDSLRCLELLIFDNLDNRNNEKISVKVIPVNFSTTAQLVQPGNDQFVGGLGDTLRGWSICPPNCEDVIPDEPFIYDIVVSDDGCPQSKSDTIRFYLELYLEPNQKPILQSNINGVENVQITTFDIGEIEVDFTGTDVDSLDFLSLVAEGVGFRLSDFGMDFTNITNVQGEVNSTFKWELDCSYFRGTERRQFQINFILDDNSCYKENVDTLTVNINVIDELQKNIISPNIFTPNGDNKNDLFVIDSLPSDVCDDKYVSFQIYNRWGRKIFETSDRRIEFDGAELNDGTYYYLIEYTESKFKNWFTILR